MMRKLIAVAALSMASTSMAQQVIEWNYNGQASALGSGCQRSPGQSGDTEFISAGNEVSVVFSRLGVELTGSGDTSKVQKKTCRVILPTKVRSGSYLASLEQTLTYGYERTNGTEGKVQVTSTFYDQTASTIERNIPTAGFNVYSAPSIQARGVSYWRVNPQWCARRDYLGNFKANLTVNGYRSSVSNDIVIQIDGHDIRFDALGRPALCP